MIAEGLENTASYNISLRKSSELLITFFFSFFHFILWVAYYVCVSQPQSSEVICIKLQMAANCHTSSKQDAYSLPFLLRSSAGSIE